MRVLVVDDSLQFAAAITRFLSSVLQLEVVGHARSGVEAIEQVSRLQPDVVLMDWMMPEMDGLEATRRIKRGTCPPHIIIVTLNDGTEYRRLAELAGADGFVHKGDLGTVLSSLLIH